MRHPLSCNVLIKKLHEEARVPAQQTDGSSGFDLHAFIDGAGKMGIPPGERRAIPTGLAVQIDQGYEGQVRPRSGNALHHGIAVLNSPGTIDSDYRGEVKVILANLGNSTFIVEDGDRIAQLVIQAVPRVGLRVVDELDDTERGGGGFGSTGT
jgi:dUTP pyrophosphatase